MYETIPKQIKVDGGLQWDDIQSQFKTLTIWFDPHK